MALTLRFREPAGASPGPKFAGEFAEYEARGQRQLFKLGGIGLTPDGYIISSFND